MNFTPQLLMQIEYSTDGSMTFKRIKTLDQVPNETTDIKLYRGCETFCQPNLVNLEGICTLTTKNLFVNSNKLSMVWDLDENTSNNIATIIFSCSGNNFYNRFDNYHTKNVVLQCRVDQKIIDAVNKSGVVNVFTGPNFPSEDLKKLKKQNKQLDSGFDFCVIEEKLSIKGTSAPSESWQDLMSALELDHYMINNKKVVIHHNPVQKTQIVENPVNQPDSNLLLSQVQQLQKQNSNFSQLLDCEKEQKLVLQRSIEVLTQKLQNSEQQAMSSHQQFLQQQVAMVGLQNAVKLKEDQILHQQNENNLLQHEIAKLKQQESQQQNNQQQNKLTMQLQEQVQQNQQFQQQIGFLQAQNAQLRAGDQTDVFLLKNQLIEKEKEIQDIKLNNQINMSALKEEVYKLKDRLLEMSDRVITLQANRPEEKQCQVCGISFQSSEQLQVHSQVHTVLDAGFM